MAEKTKRAGRARGEELLGQMAAHVVAHLSPRFLPESEASRIAADLMDRISDAFGGACIYISKRISAKAEQRDAELFARWQEGETVQALTDAYGITFVQVYKIIREGRAWQKAALEAQRQEQRAEEQRRWEKER